MNVADYSNEAHMCAISMRNLIIDFLFFKNE